MFHCKMAEYMKMLLQQKHLLGKEYITGERHLLKFDSFVIENFPDSDTITKEMMHIWAAKRSYEKIGTQRQRITPVRDLVVLMNKLGKTSYVFPMYTLQHEQRYPIHIYSKEELSAFFKQVDNCCYSSEVPYRHIVMPILFRMLYCCGLRPGEARRLLLKDVDLESGILTIRDSKFGNDRLVPLNQELTDMCRAYANTAHIYSEAETPFLLGYRNKMLTDDNLNSNFRRFLRKAGISHGGHGKGPRIYDFRHTFAVNSLKNMVLSGKDMNAYYPVLKTYMGHSFFKYTEYYLKITKDVFPEISAKIEEYFSDLIPQELGDEYENNRF